MSDAAATALFFPVATARAQARGQPPEAHAVTAATTAVVRLLAPLLWPTS